MNKILKGLIIFTIVLILGLPALAGTTHTVYGEITNPPQNPDDISIIAYITARPGEIQTEAYTGSTGYENGFWYVNTGNYSVAWSAGETLRIEIFNKATDEWDAAEVVLSNGQDVASLLTLGGTALDTPAFTNADGQALSASLEWNTVSGSNVGYNLYRRIPAVPSGKYERIEENHPNTNYTDHGLEAGATFYYLLIAKNESNSSAHSNESDLVTVLDGIYDLVEIRLDESDVTLRAAEAKTFVVEAGYDTSGDGSANQFEQVARADCAWQLSNGASGSLSNGTYAAPPFSGLAQDEDLTITVTYNDGNNSVNTIATIHLDAPVLQSISVDPNEITLRAEESHEFTVTAVFDYGDPINLANATWVIPNGEGTIQGNTYIAPLSINADETITLSCSYTHNSVVKDDSVQVNLDAVLLSSISLVADQTTVTAGKTLNLEVTASYDDDSTEVITNSVDEWIVSGADSAPVNGVFSAPSSKGVVTIQAREGNKLSDTLTISVICELNEIIVDLENDVVIEGSESIQINVLAKDTDGDIVDLSGSDLPFLYSVTGAEHGNSIDENGLFTAGSAEDVEGEHTITVSLQTDSQVLEDQVNVRVNLGAPRIVEATVGEKDLNSYMILDPLSQFEVVLQDGNGVKAESVRLLLDGNESSFSSQATVMNVGANAVSYSFTPNEEIPAGTHTLTIEFEDNLGSKGSIRYTGIKVYDALSIVGITRNYPNPFAPSVGTTLYYQLTQAASVKIYIYDLAGRLVYSTLCEEGTIGGDVGENPVFWDAKNVFGEQVANGVYVYFILTTDGKILARGEMAAYE